MSWAVFKLSTLAATFAECMRKTHAINIQNFDCVKTPKFWKRASARISFPPWLKANSKPLNQSISTEYFESPIAQN
jgi:hypothetical protein